MTRKILVREDILGMDPLDGIAPYSYNGALTVHTGKGRFRFPFAVTLLAVSAAVNGAPTGSAIIIDVKKNGTTIFPTTAKPQIAVSTNATASETVPDTTAMAAGDYLTVDITQIGSGGPGEDLTVFVRYRRVP